MSDNPLEDDPAREERIRQRAYHLWQADGEPHGRDADYWERARELVGLEGSAGAGQLPNPTTQPGFDPTRTEPVEEAFIQENLGEFPDRLADQGEVLPTPRRRQAATRPDDSPAPGAAGGAADKPSAKPARRTTAAAKPEAAAAPKPIATSKARRAGKPD